MNFILNIPVELILFVIKQKIVADFKVYVGLKIVTPGIFSKKSPCYKELSKLTGNSQRTNNKHLDTLVRLGWVGYDWQNKIYIVRPWAWIRMNVLKEMVRRSVSFSIVDMKTFLPFLAAAVLCNRIKDNEYSVNYSKRLRNLNRIRKNAQKRKPNEPVVNKRSTTQQGSLASKSASFKDDSENYFGFSNLHIAKLFGYCETYARQLKHDAEAAGYIKTIPHFSTILVLSSPDYSIRQNFYRGYEEAAKKMRFIHDTVNGANTLVLSQQMHDEISTLLRFRRINYLKIAGKKNIQFSSGSGKKVI